MSDYGILLSIIGPMLLGVIIIIVRFESGNRKTSKTLIGEVKEFKKEFKNDLMEVRCNVMEIQGTVQELSLEPNVNKSLNKTYELEIQAVNDVVLIDFLSARTKHICEALNSALASRPKTLKEVQHIKDFHTRRIIKNAGRIVSPDFEDVLKSDIELIQSSKHLCLDLAATFSDNKYNSHIERAIKITKKYLSETIRYIIIRYETNKQSGNIPELGVDNPIDIDEIKRLIANNEIDKAMKILPNTPSFILLQSQYNNNKTNGRLNLRDNEEVAVYGNKILNSIMEILEEEKQKA